MPHARHVESIRTTLPDAVHALLNHLLVSVVLLCVGVPAAVAADSRELLLAIYSVPKEAYENRLIPTFKQQWKQRTGQEIRIRGYLKPISTLRRPLQSVDFTSREPVKAAYERSDVCVVPAAGVAGEAMVALTLARSALEKFGGDSMLETLRNFRGYLEQVKNF